MQLSTLARLCLGAALLISTQVLNLFSLFRGADWLQAKSPWLFAGLSNPVLQMTLLITGFGMCAWGLYEGLKRKPPAEMTRPNKSELAVDPQPLQKQVQTTSGPNSPITTIGSIGIGAKVNIGQVTQPTINKMIPKDVGPAPNLVTLGVDKRSCHIPVFFEDLGEWGVASAECMTLAIRNSVASQKDVAYDAIAHLYFQSETYAPVRVDEGLWVENGTHGPHGPIHIGRSATKHLVIVDEYQTLCLALPRVLTFSFAGHISGLIIQPGEWRLTIEITCEGGEFFFYLDGTIQNDGSSQWSVPSTTRPPTWPHNAGQ